MRKNLKKLFLILFTLCLSVCTVFAPLSVSAETTYEKSLTKDHLVIFKGQVDPRIKANKLAFNVDLYNKDNDKTYTITFFHGSNYTTRENLPQGRYRALGYEVQGEDIEGFNANMQGFKFETKTQTTEVNYTFGDIHYSGEIKNYNYIDGMIDREGTDRIRAERGLDPIDWNKVDNPDTTSSFTSSTSSSETTSSEEITSSEEVTSSEITSSEETTSSETDNKNTENKKNKISPVSIIILILVVIAIVVAIFIRYRNNTLGGENG